jgi:putrescine aminotransferase
MLTKKIAEITPGELSISYPCNSSSEAIEGALKMARGYHKKRSGIIAISGSFHGSTMGALSVCGKPQLRSFFNDFALDVSFVNYGDVASLKEAISERTAALIMEPIMTKAGIAVAPDGYLKEVQKICRAHGTLLIFDETVTGLGHAGKWFSADENIVPDLLVIGNTLGGGILPGAAYVTTEKINKKVYGKHHPAMHGSTTGGNPLMSAAALAVLETIERENLHLQAAEHGKTIQRTLQHFKAFLPGYILNYQVCGMLASMEVPDKETAMGFQKQAMAQGVAVNTSFSGERAWIMINPPLIISPMELKKGLMKLENVILNIKNREHIKRNEVAGAAII